MLSSSSSNQHQPHPATVFLVDDDSGVRDSLVWLFQSVRLPVETFDRVSEYLAAVDDGRPGCVVADVRLPDASGLDLLARVAARDRPTPVILITGHADVPLAVRAMRGGAFDFQEKPVNDQTLLDRVQEAIRIDELNRVRWAERTAARELVAPLTDREREILKRIVTGLANKQVARQLGLSIKTVEAHRARLYEKLKCTHLGELIALAATAGIDCRSSVWPERRVPRESD